MKGLLTSCGRLDLLEQTTDSLQYQLEFKGLDVIIHEDSREAMKNHRWQEGGPSMFKGIKMIFTAGIGQHASIERFLRDNEGKFYLHLEDDWEFDNSYNWIKASLDIMNHDPSIIKVLAREGSPHPCEHDHLYGDIRYGYIHPWINNGVNWHGFSWNPGVTRLDLLKKFVPFPKWEQDLAKDIYSAGYKVAELGTPVYRHIGEGRSTHE